MSPRRVACIGPGDRPCPARAWFYYPGVGRPRSFCAYCYRLRIAERNRENWAVKGPRWNNDRRQRDRAASGGGEAA
jgi:hypothetical protein